MADEKQNLLTFFKENGILLLAIYGVVQVWIIALWKKYIKKGKIRIFETGSLEIGYSAFGPTIAVNGTLRALRYYVTLVIRVRS